MGGRRHASAFHAIRELLNQRRHVSQVAAGSFTNRKLKQKPVKNNIQDLLADLKSCSRRKDLQEGRRVHRNAVDDGNDTNTYMAAALINMYAKCGSMIDAQQVFEKIQEPNVVSWTALIMGYADNGQGQDALNLFSRMKATRRCAPDTVTYAAVIKACTSLAANGNEAAKKMCLKRGREIHLDIGRHMDHCVQNALINLYVNCGSMVDAQQVFDKIQVPNVVSWTTLIMGYADNGQGQAALDLFSEMKARKCSPNSVTYVTAVKALASLAENGNEAKKEECLKRGKEIHSEIGHHMGHFVQSTLISMYANCRSMMDARQVFDRIQKPDMVSWNALIMGYAANGEGRAALDIFSNMKNAGGYSPNSVTYVAAIRGCTSLAADGDDAGKGECLKRGKEIHSEIGHHMNHVVQNALISMYAKCGSMADARQVFDIIKEPDVVSWTTLILGYAANGEGQAALDFFSRMKTAGKCAPDTVTYIAAIKGCTSLAADQDEAGKGECLKLGREIHLEIGHYMDHFVHNTLINMYAKCGSMVDALRLFETMEKPDVVSWNALIMGYADNGEGQAALDFFSKMKAAHACAPNSVTYMAALKACASIGALAIGRKFHTEINAFDAHVVTCLVDFYSKCGSMVEARDVFDAHSRTRNISTWTALLAGYGRFGDNDTVFNLFEAMQDQGFRPNAVTFVCMLWCCNHAGLVEKAREYLEAMPVQYGVTPTLVHYNCMVDVLGRANKLDEAVALLQKMPYSPSVVTWMALLGACHKWKNVEIGRLSFQSLVDLDDKIPAAYVLMAQIYRSKGMWQDQERLLEARRKFGAWELQAEAYVMNGLGKLVKFVVGGDDPPEIQEKMKQFLNDMKEDGDISESCNIIRNVPDTEKEEALCGHSERRAIVYGILHTPPGETIRVYKNTRMCDGCHSSTKMFSKLCQRVIMVRDESRFHVMETGRCSCGDYW